MTLNMDRWLEMDLTWFDPARPLPPQIETLVARVAPLLQSAGGDRGIFFNVGWLIDLVTEWTGDPDQLIPTRSRRTAQWGTQTYAALRSFIALLRAQAAAHGVDDLKIGVLFVGWGHVVWPPELKIYDFDSDWYDRHPELYGQPLNFIGMPVLLPDRRLKADSYPYATSPAGLAEGAGFPAFFGAQWGHLADYLGLDAIHLRDGMTGPMVYTRNGPWGVTAPADPGIIEAFSRSVRDLFKEIKRASPERLVFGYSSAISPTADWRVGGVDFESLVADGFIDGWIEQTWGGAWQDWWHQLWKGWTFQLGNLLTRAQMIARANQQRETPCRFYNLIETWDGWEPWDTLHQVPNKLRWAMWAYSHVAVLTPEGTKVPDGSYISWVNNGAMDLLSEEDVRFINTSLNAAQESAGKLEKVFGPPVVYNRALLAWLTEHEPDTNATEWIDDQAALLAKWGLPVLASTRMEWLTDEVGQEGLLLQVPGHLTGESLRVIAEGPGPRLLAGRADLLEERLRACAGLAGTGEIIEAEFHIGSAERDDSPPYDRPYIAAHAAVTAAPDARVHYRTTQTPLVVEKDNFIFWQPPDWSEPFNQFVPKYQIGSTYPHYLVAQLLHQQLRAAGLSHLQGLRWETPLAFSLWSSGGSLYILLGNLESGYFGDSRYPRSAMLVLNRSQLGLGSGGYMLLDRDSSQVIQAADESDQEWLMFDIQVAPENMKLYSVVPL